MQADLPMFVYEVVHEGPGRHTQLVRHAPRVSRVRAFAEGLCRIGGYEMVWRDPAGDEVRGLDELDQPLVVRLAAGRDGDDGHVQAEPVPTRPVAGGGVEVSSRPLGPALFLLAILVPVIVVGAAALISYHNGWQLNPKTLGLGGGVVFAIAATMFLVDRLVTQPIVVTPEAVRLVWRVAGLTLRDRHLDPAHLESLYLEPDRAGTWHLVFAGDGIHRAAGRYPRLGEAVAARRAIIDGLLGRFPEGGGERRPRNPERPEPGAPPPGPRAGGRQRIIRMHLEPPRPIVVSPSRLTLGGLGTALGVPLGMALLVAHFGDLHHLHMAWFLGVMALLMLAEHLLLHVAHLRARRGASAHPAAGRPGARPAAHVGEGAGAHRRARHPLPPARDPRQQPVPAAARGRRRPAGRGTLRPPGSGRPRRGWPSSRAWRRWAATRRRPWGANPHVRLDRVSRAGEDAWLICPTNRTSRGRWRRGVVETREVTLTTANGSPMRAALAMPEADWAGPRRPGDPRHSSGSPSRSGGSPVSSPSSATPPSPGSLPRPGPEGAVRGPALRSFNRGHGPQFEDLSSAQRFLAEQPGVDPARLGVAGFCLGGGFAVASRGPFRPPRRRGVLRPGARDPGHPSRHLPHHRELRRQGRALRSGSPRSSMSTSAPSTCPTR